MSLVYKPSDLKTARKYERSSGMEPNPGVTHLSVVSNPGERVRSNPFQWIDGRGQRHRHASSPYNTIKGAVGWKKRNKRSSARLYPVDERGTVVSRPLTQKALTRNKEKSGMAYNIGALRRAMRSNPRGRKGSVKERETEGGVKVSSRGRRRSTKKRSTKRRRSVRSNRQRVVIAKNRRRSRRRSSKKTRSTRRRRSRRKSRRGASVKANARRRRSRRSSRRRRSVAPKRRRSRRRVSVKANTHRRRSRRSSRRRRSVAPKRRRSRRRVSVKANTHRRRSRRSSRRRRSVVTNRRRRRRVSANKRRSSKPGMYANRRRSRRSSRGRQSRRRVSANKAKRRSKRRSSRRSSRKSYYLGGRKVRGTGKEYIDKYIQKGYMPAVAPVYATGKRKSGAPQVLVYPIPRGQGRLSRRKTSRKTGARRSRAVGASYRKPARGYRKRMSANRKRRRSTKRRSRRRVSRRRSSGRRRSVRANRHRRRSTKRRSRRRVSRRPSRRRRSVKANRHRSRRRVSRNKGRRRSRRRLSRNLLSTSKVQYRGRGAYRSGRPRGKRHQVVMYGSRSKGRPNRRGTRRRISGYPVYVPGHVVERASVRRFKRLGGGAKDSHERAQRRGYSEKKWKKRRLKANSRRRTSMRKSRRSSRRRSRRRSTRRNPRWVVRNKHRRRVRRNQLSGATLMRDVVTPVLGGTAGFIAARVLSNGVANVAAIRDLLDKEQPAETAENTKIAANVLGILATLGLAPRIPMLKANQGAVITGMGLALTDRLLGKITGPAASYLSGLGEYVSQPLGEYVSQPLGAYVQDPGMLGEYVSQPLGDTLYAAAGMGDTLYAAAGMGAYPEGVDPGNQMTVDAAMDSMETMQAAAGIGTMYATAGLGESDARLQKMWGRNRPPFASIQTPTDVAMSVDQSMPFARPVPDSMVTPEGRGFAGGLFARSLYAGMC